MLPLYTVEHFFCIYIYCGKIKPELLLKKTSIPDNISYQVKLIEKIKSVLKRVLWKAHFFLNQSKKRDNIKTTYGFKSKLHPQQHPDLEAFEENFAIL